VFGIYGVFFAGALLVVAFVAVRELYLRDTLGEDLEGVPGDTRD
jgi:predicted PurR-regulated permease PerM